MSNQLVKSFNDTIKSESLGLAKEYAEVTLDAILSDGILKDIPLVGTLVSVFKLGSTLKDRHTFKKLAVFLDRLSDIPLEDREKFIKQLSESDEYNEKVSEKVLLMIDRLDETKKAEFVGNLFKLYVLDMISKEEFLRLSGIVERAQLYDLLALHYKYSWYNKDWEGIQPYTYNKDTENSLLGLGLIQQKVKSPIYSERAIAVGRIEEPTIEYEINSMGRKLANYLIYDLNNPDFAQSMEATKAAKSEKEKMAREAMEKYFAAQRENSKGDSSV